MFKVGDNIFYPLHGAGTIESIEEKNILGENKKYYVMKMPIGDVKVMVPTENAENVGVRNIIGDSLVKKTFQVFENIIDDEKPNWSKRYKENMEKMKTGDILEMADVVRTLTFKQKEKGLSTGEKKMLSNAKQILISELVLAHGQDETYIEQQITEMLSDSYQKKMDRLIDLI